ncbi:MAG: UvrB/UvrC motif-containing protein, partial [Bacillota bacterium]|nr:UvrB/UvrC motif-containing protein [Bacillota bacterium]
YENFRSTGLFGCSECYKAFDRHLDQVLRRIQGSTEHTGKVPVRIGGAGELDRQIGRLRSQLQLAVEREEYERAAAIRDQIRALEEQRRQKEAQKEQEEKKEHPTTTPPR